ncbi:hypothetical protein EPN44_08015 [bacterium]|nr:MAG: hypothetical protein EPN44_08015 [bacterium]
MIVDLGALVSNARAWRAFTGGRRLYAVVKADAYGIGAERAVRALEEHVDGWCVTSLEEARAVRARSRRRIICIATLPCAHLPQAVALGVEVSVTTPSEVAALTRIAGARGKRVRAQLAVRSAAGWIGVAPERVGELARTLAENGGIEIVEAWTHLSGEREAPGQLAAFRAVLGAIESAGLLLQGYHIASTAPALWLDDVPGGAVRIGIGLFGSTMGVETKSVPALQQVLEVGAVIDRADEVEPGVSVGYGAAYVTKPGDHLVTARFGYSDGMPRSFVASGPTVTVETRELVVVAMGMQFLTCVGDARVGERIEVLGPCHPLDRIAQSAGVLPHELVLSLARGSRIAGTLVDSASRDGYTTCGDSR